jgi:hypothetical protein
VPVVTVDIIKSYKYKVIKPCKAGKARKFRNYLMKLVRATTRRNIEKGKQRVNLIFKLRAVWAFLLVKSKYILLNESAVYTAIEVQNPFIRDSKQSIDEILVEYSPG